MPNEVHDRARDVLRRATTALLRRDLAAFDAVCAPWFKGEGARLLATLDEENPYPGEDIAFPSRFVLDDEWLDENEEERVDQLQRDQREDDVHPVHLISREVTPDILVGFPRVDVYGEVHPAYDIGHQAELYFTLALLEGEVVVAHCWVNNYDGDDDYGTVEDYEDLEALARPQS